MKLRRGAALALVPTLLTGCGGGEGAYGSTADIGTLLNNLESSVVGLYNAWNDIPPQYRGIGCISVAIFLVLRATSPSAQHGRGFFITGLIALAVLAYGGVMLFQNGR